MTKHIECNCQERNNPRRCFHKVHKDKWSASIYSPIPNKLFMQQALYIFLWRQQTGYIRFVWVYSKQAYVQNMCFTYLRTYLSRRFTNMWQPPIKLTCSRKEASSCFWETARITICRTSSMQATSWLRSKKAMRDFISDAEICCLHKEKGMRTSSKDAAQKEIALFIKTKTGKLSRS